MLYLEMAASRERIGEIRRQVEHNRLESALEKARLSNQAVLQEVRPRMSVLTSAAWRIERWQGAGW